MRRAALLLLTLAGCPTNDAPVHDDAGPLPSADIARCRTVGEAYCEAQVKCRFLTPVDACEARWDYFQCRPPERLTDAQAEACGEMWYERSFDCDAWYHAGWWEDNAPKCAEVLAH